MKGGRKALAIIIGFIIITILIMGMVSSFIILVLLKDTDRETDIEYSATDPYSIENPDDIEPIDMTEGEEMYLFDEAYQSHSEENYEIAIKRWHKIYRSTEDLARWGKATFNIGNAYFCLERYDNAMYYFREVLSSDVDDWEPGEDIMETNRNYHHRACINIAKCFEMEGEFVSALNYLTLARDEYTYVSWCGTCLDSQYEFIDNEIDRIETLIQMAEEGVFLSQLIYEIEIINRMELNYSFLIPVPTYENINGSVVLSFGLDDIVVMEGSPKISFIQTERGPALNISSNVSCSLDVNITLKNGIGVEDSDIFDDFSMPDICSGWYWVYTDFKWGTGLRITFHGSWLCLKPHYERYNWYYEYEPYYPWHEVKLL